MFGLTFVAGVHFSRLPKDSKWLFWRSLRQNISVLNQFFSVLFSPIQSCRQSSTIFTSASFFCCQNCCQQINLIFVCCCIFAAASLFTAIDVSASFFNYWSTFAKSAFSEIESMTRPFKKSAFFTDGHNFGLILKPSRPLILEFPVLFSLSYSVCMAWNLNLKLDLFWFFPVSWFERFLN
jgi:hypothetical protein